MMNWINKNERLPTKEDADNQGYVVGLDKSGARCYLFHNVRELNLCTHWIGMKDITKHVPIPKRWRVPTIHDLAKAGKPIPCRVRDTIEGEWTVKALCAIDVNPDATVRFYSMDGWYEFCEREE